MRTEETQFADVTVLTVAGRIDQETSPELQRILLPAVGQLGGAGRQGLVIDFSGVPYMSSAGLRALMVGAKECKARGGKLAVAGLQPIVREVFQISRFDKVIATFASVHEAIASISTAASAAFNSAHPD